MLGLLLKYDFRALNKTMIPLQLGVLAAALLGTLCTGISVRLLAGNDVFSSYPLSESVSIVAELFSYFSVGIATSLAILLFSLVFVSSFVTLLLIARNIYKNFYSSEGYLSFTLPVTAKQHILSKVISGFIWMLVNAIIVILAVFLLVLFGLQTEGFINTMALELLSELFLALFDPVWMLYFIEICLLSIISILLAVYQVLFSIVIGGALARTHKVLASVGVYIAASALVGIITSASTFFTTLFTSMSNIPAYSDIAIFTASQPTFIASGVLSIIFILIFHFVSKASLERSLNLD